MLDMKNAPKVPLTVSCRPGYESSAQPCLQNLSLATINFATQINSPAAKKAFSSETTIIKKDVCETVYRTPQTAKRFSYTHLVMNFDPCRVYICKFSSSREGRFKIQSLKCEVHLGRRHGQWEEH